MRRATAACAARLWTHGSFARALSTVRTPTDRRTSVGSAHSVIHGSPAASEAAYTARRRRLGQNAPHQAPELGPRSVFVNQEVALAQLEWVGFDADYTLATYTPALSFFIYEKALRHLIAHRLYPDSLSGLRLDPGFAIRGLSLDTRRGILAKLDFLHSVAEGCAYFGRTKLAAADIVNTYGSHVVPSDQLAAFRPFLDAFSVPEATLIADVIQHFSERGISFSAAHVYDDVKASIGHLHNTGVLHDAISADPQRFLTPAPEVAELLRSLRAAGKRTFLLTNSRYSYISAVLRHLLGGDEAWHEQFDFTICSAEKPAFFMESRPFRSLNRESGKLRWVPVDSLQRGAVYHGGSLAELNRLTHGALGGGRVLYVGDHVFSDLRRPARSGWRTCAIISELEVEVETQNSARYRDKLSALLGVEAQLRATQQLGGGDAQAALRRQRAELRAELKALFNAHFGSCFRSHNGPSLYMTSVLRFCDVYTSRVGNLSLLDLRDGLLFPRRAALPHEPAPAEAPPPPPPGNGSGAS